MSTDCAVNGVTNSNVLNQTFISTNIIAPDALIDFAYLTNKCFAQPYRDLQLDKVIEIDPYDLSFLDFTSCFYYQSAGNFNINLANKNFKPLLLNNQKYTTTDGKKFICNLYTLCLKAYANKNQISENTIPPNKKIILANEVFLCQSLATNIGIQNSLSWDTCLNTLQSTGQILFTGDTDHEARVSFKLTYIYHSEILNTTISIIFTYKTHIPCYKNIYSNIEHNIPFSYSKYEDSTIEDIKKELQESLSKETKVMFDCSNFSSSLNNQEDYKIKHNVDNISVGGESTIKTTALLKEISSGLWNDQDEDDTYEDEDEYKDEDDNRDW
jgi:hypothetical protein